MLNAVLELEGENRIQSVTFINQPEQAIYGVITTGNNWLLLRFAEGMTIEVATNTYSLTNLEKMLGALQHIINQFK